jgi:hypothetical protein
MREPRGKRMSAVGSRYQKHLVYLPIQEFSYDSFGDQWTVRWCFPLTSLVSARQRLPRQTSRTQPSYIITSFPFIFLYILHRSVCSVSFSFSYILVWWDTYQTPSWYACILVPPSEGIQVSIPVCTDSFWMTSRFPSLSSCPPAFPKILRIHPFHLLDIVLQFNSRNSRSVSLGCWVMQTHVPKHTWPCSNLRLHELQTQTVRVRCSLWQGSAAADRQKVLCEGW